MKYLLVVTDSLGDVSYPNGVKIEDTYPYKLEMALRPDVYTKSFVIQGNTITSAGDQVRTWFDMLGDSKLDIAVVQVGIVDSAIRVVPIFIYHAIPYLPGPIREMVFKFIHQNRPFLQKMGLRFHFTSVKTYRKRLGEMIDRLQQKCHSVIIVSITPGRQDVYEHSPGLAQSIKSYNDCIREVTSSRKVHFIDLTFMEAEPEKYLSPRLHILKGGHEYIFNEIVAALKKDGKL
jgi:hypothetical protein